MSFKNWVNQNKARKIIFNLSVWILALFLIYYYVGRLFGLNFIRGVYQNEIPGFIQKWHDRDGTWPKPDDIRLFYKSEVYDPDIRQCVPETYCGGDILQYDAMLKYLKPDVEVENQGTNSIAVKITYHWFLPNIAEVQRFSTKQVRAKTEARDSEWTQAWNH